MKAQIFYQAEKMVFEEIPVPEVTETEVLIKVNNVGICGSDVSYYYGLSPLETSTGKGPLVLGHEFTGEVAKVGRVPMELGLFKQGDRVVVNPVQNCGACYTCASGQTHLCENISTIGVSTNGGFAEYCLSKYTGLFKLPENISYAAGAFVEPLACAMYAMKKLDIKAGQFVVIFGPGPMGQMMVQMAKSIGAGKVALIGTRDYRLETGKKLGADYLFNTKQKESEYYVSNLKEVISDITNGRLAERAIVPTSSNKAFEKAVEITGNRSIIVHFGLPNKDDVIHIPALNFHTMDKEIRSSWLAPLSWPTAIRSIEARLVNVEALVTHVYSLEETEMAIVNLRNRFDNPMKVQIAL
jgi:L-iditol 2-dehydrogenase